MKSHTLEEKIFKSYSQQGTICIQRTLKTQYKENNRISKQANDLNRDFTKKDIVMANKCMKRCFTSLVTGEMQLKITWGITTHLSEQLKQTIETTPNAGEDAENLDCRGV